MWPSETPLLLQEIYSTVWNKSSKLVLHSVQNCLFCGVYFQRPLIVMIVQIDSEIVIAIDLKPRESLWCTRSFVRFR